MPTFNTKETRIFQVGSSVVIADGNQVFDTVIQCDNEPHASTLTHQLIGSHATVERVRRTQQRFNAYPVGVRSFSARVY